MIPIAKPLLGEEEKRAVLEVLSSGMLAQGSRVKAFEQAFASMCGTRFAVATSSGTTALHVSLLANRIGSGDEVITTPFTFIASVNSILYTGARPVFVDIDPETYNIDASQIEAAITPRTKAILPVHLFGLSCEMDSILAIAEINNLKIIEDACQSHGAVYKGKVIGSFGTGAFSFYPTKNMTSAEGGMITTNDEILAEKCQTIRQHGMRRRYYHDELGYNYRMTDVHAAIGLEQLKKLEHFNQVRRDNAHYLSSNLEGVSVPVEPPGCHHVYHQYTIRIKDGRRDALRAQLMQQGIGSEVYYPVPIHQQESYTHQFGKQASFPKVEQASQEVLSLPVHPALTQADLESIVQAVNDFFKEG
jgi:dTDP-4-amino-4,6-dideoxygalactose transaminase